MKFYEKYNLKHFKEFWLKIVPKEFNERFRFKIISSVDQIKKELEMEKKKLGDKPREKVTTEEYWAFICKDKE